MVILVKQWRRLLVARSQFIVITQPPTPPAQATRQEMLAGIRPPFFESLADRQSRISANTVLREFESSRVRILEVADLFLDENNAIKLFSASGRLTFQDRGHLSNAGTAVVRPLGLNSCCKVHLRHGTEPMCMG